MPFRTLAVVLIAASSLQAQPPGGGRGFGRGPGRGPGGPGGSGDGIWRRNAYFGEAETFDACLGHQPGDGLYHNHVQPICLRAQLGDNVTLLRSTRVGMVYAEKTAPWKHSPILGWALDGFPIYGPYGYSQPKDPKSPVRRMNTGYRLRRISARTSLPDWALPNHPGVPQELPSDKYGPAPDSTSPLGRYVEDYEYVSGLGDLDRYNGRFAVTPEYPEGTYAYFLTIDAAGKPEFPYIFGGEYYGEVSRDSRVPGDATDYFTDNSFVGEQSTSALLTSWKVSEPGTVATIVNGTDPAAGPVATWSGGSGGRGGGRGGELGRGRGEGPGRGPGGRGGGVSAPASADIQRIRQSESAVYVDSNGLPSYTIGPWFMPGGPGGVFVNYPAKENLRFEFPKAPQPAESRTATGMGPAGVWVNGVAAFNFLDGASYSTKSGADSGGGRVAKALKMVSAASLEGGPAAPGSLITAFPVSGAVVSDAGGATVVTVTDSAGVARSAEVNFVSSDKLTYRLPEDTSTGTATVTVAAGANSTSATMNVVACYPNLFEYRGGVAKAGSRIAVEGSGLGAEKRVAATVGGMAAEVVSLSSSKGIDRFEIAVPKGVTGKAEVVVTAGGRRSNGVEIDLR